MQVLDEVVAWPALGADEEDRFCGDLAFSLRLQFPDAWNDLTNPHTMADPAFTMRARITTTRDDFPAHVDELSVTGIALYCLHQQGFAEEIGIASLSLQEAFRADSAAGGRGGTRGATAVVPHGPTGNRWPDFTGRSPIGDWTLQLEATDLLRDWCRRGEILDLVFVISVDGVVAEWPMS